MFRQFSKGETHRANRHTKSWSGSLATKEMPIKTVRLHLIPVKIAIIQVSKIYECYKGYREKDTLMLVEMLTSTPHSWKFTQRK